MLRTGQILLFDRSLASRNVSRMTTAEKKIFSSFDSRYIPMKIVELQSGNYQNTYYVVNIIDPTGLALTRKFVTERFLCSVDNWDGDPRVISDLMNFGTDVSIVSKTSTAKAAQNMTNTETGLATTLVDQGKTVLKLGMRVKGGKSVAKLIHAMLEKNRNLPFMVRGLLSSDYALPAIAALAASGITASKVKDPRLVTVQESLAEYAGVALIDMIPVDEYIECLFNALPPEVQATSGKQNSGHPAAAPAKAPVVSNDDE